MDRGVPFRVLGLADAIYAKTWASTIDKLGLKVRSEYWRLNFIHLLILNQECMREDRKVGENRNGSDNFILKDSFKVAIDTFSKGVPIMKNWQVDSSSTFHLSVQYLTFI